MDPNLRPTTRKSNSYLIEKGLVFEHFRDALLSPTGRFIFSPITYSHYNFLDLVHGKVSEMRLREADVFSMKRLKVFPLNDFSVLLIAWPGNGTDQSPFHHYHTAIYYLEREPLDLSQGQDNVPNQQPLEWKPVIKIPKKHEIQYFMNDTRVYMKCCDKQTQEVTLHYFDLSRNGKFVQNFAKFGTDFNGENISKLREYTEFPLYHDGFLYSFRKISRLTGWTKSIRHVYEYFSQIYQHNTATGKVELVPVGDLRFLDIPDFHYNENSVFVIDGQWCNQNFYLHVRIRKPTSVKHPIHYFARFDLKTMSWSPLNVQLMSHRWQCQLKLFVTHEDVLVLVQFHNTPKKELKEEKVVLGKRKPKVRPHRCKEYGSIYKANFYRIPLRQPETLNTLAQLAYNKYFDQQPEENKNFMEHTFAGIQVKPVYYP